MPRKKKPPVAHSHLTPSPSWHLGWVIGMGLLVLVTAGVRFAEPLPDGDLWWHLVYARHMIENGTLIPDHTAFSWTPSEGGNIKVDWLSELILYGLFQLGGLSLMFALRYGSLLLFAGLFLFFSRRWDVWDHPLGWLIFLLGALMSYTGNAPKPELFSYVILVLVVATWFWIKTQREKGWWCCYLFPLLILIWANSHAGVQVGMTILAVVGIGELLSFWLGAEKALPGNVMKHLVFGLALCGVSIFLTPYGWSYPASLVEKLTSRDYGELRTVHAFLSIFDQRADTLPFEEYLLVIVPILGLVAWKRWRWKELDWALILINLFLAWFYMQFIRSTYYWGPVFALSGLYLLAGRRHSFLWPRSGSHRLWFGGGIVAVALGLAGMSVYDSTCRASLFRYFGFGYSYANAVEESQFIKDHLPGYRFGNSYDAGGYMLWSMWPERKVFIDPRYFPFKSWYGDYLEFINGRRTAELVNRFPAEVWYVRYHDPPVIDWFVQSPEWKLAFYGTSGAIFVRKQVVLPEGVAMRSEAIDHIRNHYQATQILLFESKLMAFSSAERTLAMMQECFSCPNEESLSETAEVFLKGMEAFHQHDFERAAEYLEKAKRGGTIYNDVALTQAYHHLAAAAWQQDALQEGLELAEKSLSVRPNSLHGLYNAGIAEWYLHQTLSKSGPGADPMGMAGRSGKWRQRLEVFVKLSETAPHIPREVRQVAQSLLSGNYSGQPPMMAPTVLLVEEKQDTISGRAGQGPDPG